MPTIQDLEYGYNTDGVEAFIEAIKAQALNEASETVKNISKIRETCENNWEGKARENFIHNLEQDSTYVANQFERLYSILVKEIGSLSNAMQNKDGDLIKSDNAGSVRTVFNNFQDFIGGGK